MNMDKDHVHVSLLLLLDLSAAFDTADLGIFGYNSFKQNWVSVVMLFPGANRTWKRDLKESAYRRLSQPFDLRWGVPQGSFLGPTRLLFILKICSLFWSLLCQLHMHTRTRTQLYLSFSPNVSTGGQMPSYPLKASSETQGQIAGAREGLNRREKKSKERREDPLGTMSYQTSSKRSPPFYLLIGVRKLLCFSGIR